MQAKVARGRHYSHESSFTSGLSEVNCRHQPASFEHRDEVSLAIFPCLGHVVCRTTGVTRACALGLDAAADPSSISSPFPSFLSIPPTPTFPLTHIHNHRPSLPVLTTSYLVSAQQNHDTMTSPQNDIGHSKSLLTDRKGKGRVTDADAGATDNSRTHNERSRAQPGKVER
jgi:hypothetical protein